MRALLEKVSFKCVVEKWKCAPGSGKPRFLHWVGAQGEWQARETVADIGQESHSAKPPGRVWSQDGDEVNLE